MEARLAASGPDDGAGIGEAESVGASNGDVSQDASESIRNAPAASSRNGASNQETERPDEPVGTSQTELDAAVARIPDSVRRELDELFRAKFVTVKQPPPRSDDT